MKETFYFSHDFNAFSDSKIQEMTMDHGTGSYGYYWYLIESLAQETERWFLPKKYVRIAYVLRIDTDVIRSIIEDYGLFEFDEENFWNKRLDKHFDQRAKKSALAKKAVEKRWEKQRKVASKSQSEDHTDVLRPQYDSNTIKESKGKESKGKETIIKRFKVPEIKEIEIYFVKKNSDLNEASKFFNFYESKGWMVGRSKMKKWESAASGWIIRDNTQSNQIQTVKPVRQSVIVLTP